jgi:hypothetical protein
MRKLLTFVLAVAILFSFSLTANATYKNMWAQVYSWDGKMTADGKLELTKLTSGVTYVVMMKNSTATLESLYYYNSGQMTTQANPVTGTNYTSATIGNDMIRFKVDPTETNDAAVDLIVVDQSGGYTAFVEDFDQYTHSIIIDERPNIRHHGVAFLYTTGSSSEVDTGIAFDKVSVIDDIMVEVGTAFSSNTTLAIGILSTGTNGDKDGFLIEKACLATAGYHTLYEGAVDLTVPVVSSGGERAGFINSSYIGTFLGNFMQGTSDSALAEAGVGDLYRHPLLIHGSWENNLSYIFSTLEATTGWGLIHFWFTRIR